MNSFSPYLFFIWIIPLSAFGQNQDTIKLIKNPKLTCSAEIIWGDLRLMEKHSNGVIFQFKSGLEDCEYRAFFDKNYKDTAMIVQIKKGEIEGLLRRWDDEDKRIAEECEYSNGVMHGYRKLYYFDPNGVKYMNIEQWENGVHIKDIQIEW